MNLALVSDREFSSSLTLPPTAAYLHIPFCRRRCFYCDFAVSIVGDRPVKGAEYGTIAQYVELLCQEILTTPVLGGSLQTVFFGGGTPSLLSVQQLFRILETLDRHFGIAPTAEISMEIDPATFDLAQLQGYRSAGVNRVSLGVQAFQDELLELCGRTHRARDIDIAVDLLHQADLTNFSLDLISGLPHQTIDHWQESLQKAIDFAPPHLSVYDLTVEPGTAFSRRYHPGADPLPSEETTAQMYRLAQQTLTSAGYDHYEVSNYARSGFQCRHNRVYWQNRSYYGFGMGAASYTQNQRFTRPRTQREYAQWVQTYQLAQGAIDCPFTPTTEVLLDTLMVGLRLAEGLSLSQLQQQFGQAAIDCILKCLAPYQQQAWVKVKDDRICLTDPEGFLFSNVVLSRLFEQFEP